LTEIFRGCDSIVHIAAWHGIHEGRGEKDTYDFFDLKLRGTFEVFEAAATAGSIRSSMSPPPALTGPIHGMAAARFSPN
jgi:hypothetical protein